MKHRYRVLGLTVAAAIATSWFTISASELDFRTSCGGCGAGQLVVADYVGVGPIWGNRRKSGGDEGAAELGEHVLEGGLGLLVVPGLAGTHPRVM